MKIGLNYHLLLFLPLMFIGAMNDCFAQERILTVELPDSGYSKITVLGTNLGQSDTVQIYDWNTEGAISDSIVIPQTLNDTFNIHIRLERPGGKSTRTFKYPVSYGLKIGNSEKMRRKLLGAKQKKA